MRVCLCNNSGVTRDPLYAEIGQLIRSKRKALRRKQESLASELGISRGSLANIETGRQGILVHQLYRFAAALKLTPAELLPAPREDKRHSGAELPLPTDLKAQQRRQITDLIMQVDTNSPSTGDKTHAQKRKR